ncbi:MAG TPA: nucleoside deaminase [Pseudolabrys sp.]|nr:nucleoside deaminase [Pseudolabrys sp.]
MFPPDPQTGDEDMMRRCFELAAKSAGQGEYPYAAVIVRNGQIVAETINRVVHKRDVTHHAELVAISLAQRALDSTDLADCTIYSNVEPCAFCCYAIRESRIGKVVFSMRSPVMGGASRWNILGDCKLSDMMPEVFAPPPVLLAEFLCEEGDATMRRSAPAAWAFMRARGLLAPPQAAGNRADEGANGRGYIRVVGWLLHALRRNLFDRFGRGGGRRRRAGKRPTPSP